MNLNEMNCEACRADMPPVHAEETSRLIQQIPDWKIVEENQVQRLQRVFTFTNFVNAMAFTCRVGELAEDAGHHPALLTEWGKVTVQWWTHKIGGLHVNDFILAAKTDGLHHD